MTMNIQNSVSRGAIVGSGGINHLLVDLINPYAHYCDSPKIMTRRNSCT